MSFGVDSAEVWDRVRLPNELLDRYVRIVVGFVHAKHR